MSSSRYPHRALRGLGGAFVLTVALAALGLSSGVASAKPDPSFAVSCSSADTTASWSGVHVKGIDLTWLDSSGGVAGALTTDQARGGTLYLPYSYGAASVQATFHFGPGKTGSSVDTESASCS